MESSNFDGKSLPVGAQRGTVFDILHLASQVPAFPVEGWFEMAPLIEARASVDRRISWAAIFTRGYGLACRSCPELRRCYIRFPYPRLFQAKDISIAIAINRSLQGQDGLYFARLHHPDQRTLEELQDELDAYQSRPVKEVFRQQTQAERIPSLLRRLGWFWRMQVAVAKRGRRVGVGSISTLAGQGVLNRRHPCMLTSSLSYGPADQDGRMWVTLQCDHRVLDGTAAARAFNGLHQAMHQVILPELLQMVNPNSAIDKRAVA